jgi:hypothetical protein
VTWLLPPEVLVLTYELQRPDQVDDYLSQKFAPMVPLLVFGRAASSDPGCERRNAVFYGWKDQSFATVLQHLSNTFWHPGPFLISFGIFVVLAFGFIHS